MPGSPSDRNNNSCKTDSGGPPRPLSSVLTPAPALTQWCKSYIICTLLTVFKLCLEDMAFNYDGQNQKCLQLTTLAVSSSQLLGHHLGSFKTIFNNQDITTQRTFCYRHTKLSNYFYFWARSRKL